MSEQWFMKERIRRVARLRFEPELEQRFRANLRDWLRPTRTALFLIFAVAFGLGPLYHDQLLSVSPDVADLMRTLELGAVFPITLLAALVTWLPTQPEVRQAVQTAAVLTLIGTAMAFRWLSLNGALDYPPQMIGIILLAVCFFGGFSWWRIGPFAAAVAVASIAVELRWTPAGAPPEAQAYSLLLMAFIAMLGAYHLEFLMRLTWWDYTRLRRTESALRQSEQRFKAFMDHIPATAWIKDAEGRYVFRNKAHRDRYGEPGADWTGRRDAELFPTEAASRYAGTDNEVLATGKPLHYDTVNQDREGRAIDWWIHKFPITGEGGETMVGGIGMDVSERKRLLGELRESESRLQAFLDNNPGLSWMKDEDGRYVYASTSFLQAVGATDVRGKTDAEFLPESFVRRLRDLQRKVLESGQVQVTEGFAREVAAPDRYWTLTMFPFTDAAGRRFTGGIATDITQRKRAEDLVRQQALQDDLTKLHNRRGFNVLADQELRRARRSGRECTLLYVDLDDLKAINDRHGHAAGDRALIAVSDALRSATRGSDIVARIGGDEFVVFAIDSENSMALRERVQAQIEACCAEAKLPFRLTASMGVIKVDSQVGSVEQALASADARMYERKRQRKALEPRPAD